MRLTLAWAVLAFTLGLTAADYAQTSTGNYSYTVSGSSLLVMLTGAGTCGKHPLALAPWPAFALFLKIFTLRFAFARARLEYTNNCMHFLFSGWIVPGLPTVCGRFQAALRLCRNCVGRNAHVYL